MRTLTDQTAAGLLVTPGESPDAATMRLQTSGGCPADADAYNAVMKGHGLPADGLVITATTSAGMSHTQGFEVFPSQTLQDFAADANTTFTGDYQVSVYCVDSFAQDHKSEFSATIRVPEPGHYVALGDAKGPQTLTPRAELDPPPPSAPPPATAPAPAQSAAPAVPPPVSPPSGTDAGPRTGTTTPVPVSATAPHRSTSDGWLVAFAVVAAIALAVAAVVLTTTVLRRRRTGE